ncbi:MAG: TIR domain-containing protein [Bacillota bacterium]
MNKLARLPAIDRAARASARQLWRVRRRPSRYFAFLSYSHKDKELADWLHSQLEQFRVPGNLAGQLTENGVIPRRLMPIFRDEHELAAADDLSEEIEEALANSQFLIVLCSPDAARSRWTNAEIETFKRTRPDGCVYAAIASGEPFASDIDGRESEECFPPALRHKYDRRGRPTTKRAEPLAADLRGGGEARRLGLMKLIAGMLGVGLDDLVQRDATRRQRRLAMLAAASLAGMAVTSTLAVTAIQARDAARDQRREAEGLIAFMLGDLKDKLEPIGKLDALDGVGSRVLDYYHKENTGELSDAALLQRSRALSLMAEVAYERSDLDASERLYREALNGTAEAVRRNPDDPQRLFDHAQNVYWIGDIAMQRGNLGAAEREWREYKRLATAMVSLAPDNMKWRMETQYAEANLGEVLVRQRRFPEAAAQFSQALQTIDALTTADPGNRDYQTQLVQALAWLADAQESQGRLQQAIGLRERLVALLDRLITQSNGDVIYRQDVIDAHRGLGRLYDQIGRGELALQHFKAAVAASEDLVATEPLNNNWAAGLARSRLTLAKYYIDHGQNGEAAAQVDAACPVYSRFAAREPKVPSWAQGVEVCLLDRARLAAAAGSTAHALAFADRAVAAARSIKSNDSAGDSYRLAEALRVRGDIYQASNNGAAARASWAEAAAALPAPPAESPEELNLRRMILQRNGRLAEAAPIAAKLSAIGYRRGAG